MFSRLVSVRQGFTPVLQLGPASCFFWPADASGWMITPCGNLTIENASNSAMLAMPMARRSALMSRSDRYRHHLLYAPKPARQISLITMTIAIVCFQYASHPGLRCIWNPTT